MSKHWPPDEEFVITDPEQQPGVVLEVKQGIRPVMLLDGYLSDKLVRCSFCKQRQRHRKGIFALLPDGQKALCGHCCAVEFTSKATVAKIEKALMRRLGKEQQRKVSKGVLEGVPELLEILDRDFIPVERTIHDVMQELEDIFPTLRHRKRPKLAVARGGLAAIMKMAEEKLSEPQIEKILKKRKLINEAIQDGLSLLEQGAKAVDADHVRDKLQDLVDQCGYEEGHMQCRTIIVGKWESYLGEYDFWETTYEIPAVCLPDKTEIVRLLNVA